MNANAKSDGTIQMAWGIDVDGQTEKKSIKIILITQSKHMYICTCIG